MIKITDLVDEIRTGYGKAVNNTILDSGHLITYLNSGLIELNKEGFLMFNDVIDFSLTDDKDYYLGENVSKVQRLLKFVTELKEYKEVTFSTPSNKTGVILRSVNHIWFDSPLQGDRYRVEVATVATPIDKNYFVDIVEYFVNPTVNNTIFNNLNSEQVELNFDIKPKLLILDNAYKRKQVLFNNKAMVDIVSISTVLKPNVTYYIKNASYIIYSFLEALITKTTQNISVIDVYYTIKNIAVIGGEFDFPDYFKNIVILDNTSSVALSKVAKDFGGQVLSGKTVIIRTTGNLTINIDFDDSVLFSSTYLDTYDYSVLTKYSSAFLVTRLRNSYGKSKVEEITEFDTINTYAIAFNSIKQDQRFWFMQMKEAEVQVNLSALKNVLDIPSYLKEALVLYVANKVMLSFNPNANEFNSIFFKAYKEELYNLQSLGFRVYTPAISKADIKFKSGLI